MEQSFRAGRGHADAPGRLVRAGLLCGLAAPVLWAGMIVIAGELRPGFDHIGQYISELGERGSANAMFMRYGGFVATGLMHVGYAAAFHATLVRLTDRPRLTLLVAALIALNGIGRIGAGIFSCEPGCAAPTVIVQRLHSLSATLASSRWSPPRRSAPSFCATPLGCDRSPPIPSLPASPA